jgi:acetyltransferase-like isoleucine patch superfamily enzyme
MSQLHIQREMGTSGKSKLRLYGELIVGKPGLGALLAYEAITCLATYAPGALGLLLRAKLYPLLLGSCGKGVAFGHGVVLRHPHKIHLGDGTVIDDQVLLDAKGSDNQGIRLGAGCFVGRNSILSCKNGDIVLGDRVNIGFNSEVFSGSKVELGNDCLLAAYTYVVGGGHSFEDVETSVIDQDHVSAGIRLGEGVWLGAGVKVMDGVTIGARTVVGAGAVVTKDLPERVIAAGLPAKVVRERGAAPAQG